MSSRSVPSVHPGVILKTERFEACVRFYRDLLGLGLRWEKPDLCCLRFGSGSLTVERDGIAADGPQPARQNPNVLRFHVPDLATSADAVRRGGNLARRLKCPGATSRGIVLHCRILPVGPDKLLMQVKACPSGMTDCRQDDRLAPCQ